MDGNPDIFGIALHDYYNNNYKNDIIVHSSIAEDDILPIPYLFRSFQEMPLIEQRALQLATGKVLDVGCGAGSHSLWLQEQGLDVMGIDISEGAVTLSRKRSLKKVKHQHLLHHFEQYNTILLLMNGTGIFENVDSVDRYLKHLKTMLLPNGQILIDGSDIKFMYEDEDGGYWMDMHKGYYGEVTMAMSYKGERSRDFEWLYLDFETLQQYVKKNELNCELILEGDHYEYLARITGS